MCGWHINFFTSNRVSFLSLAVIRPSILYHVQWLGFHLNVLSLDSLTKLQYQFSFLVQRHLDLNLKLKGSSKSKQESPTTDADRGIVSRDTAQIQFSGWLMSETCILNNYHIPARGDAQEHQVWEIWFKICSSSRKTCTCHSEPQLQSCKYQSITATWPVENIFRLYGRLANRDRHHDVLLHNLESDLWLSFVCAHMFETRSQLLWSFLNDFLWGEQTFLQ